VPGVGWLPKGVERGLGPGGGGSQRAQQLAQHARRPCGHQGVYGRLSASHTAPVHALTCLHTWPPHRRPPPTPPLSPRAVGNMVVTLTPSHATVQVQSLHTPPRAHACKGLNGSLILAAAFDPARPYRAYAVNDRAQLLVLIVPHEQRSATCKVCALSVCVCARASACACAHVHMWGCVTVRVFWAHSCRPMCPCAVALCAWPMPIHFHHPCRACRQ